MNDHRDHRAHEHEFAQTNCSFPSPPLSNLHNNMTKLKNNKALE